MVHAFQKVIGWPRFLYQTGLNIYQQYSYEKNASFRWRNLSIDSKDLTELEKNLMKPAAINVKLGLKPSEERLIEKVKAKTAAHNVNNLTRTAAYLEFYQQNPEVHWSLLAHLVSRNGGWNMTDLKGSLYSGIFTAKRCKAFFMFLEKANALIFQDAFAQLLLYEESKRQRKNLFHLLPHFGVSSFMKPVWDLFYKNQNSQLLTVALIINEQHYIEKRVIQESYFKANVLDTLLFKGQEFFQFTFVLFPYFVNHSTTRVIGLNVDQFATLKNRIALGKQLYALLFGIEQVYNDTANFFGGVPHTGSRSDYWPNVFATDDSVIQESSNCIILCQSKTPVFYSPGLAEAWGDVEHVYDDKSDWYTPQKSAEILHYFSSIDTPKKFEVTYEYCKSLQKLQAAAHAYGKGKELL